MAYEFHYTPTGTGVISGKEVLEQTEDAINDLGNTAISGVQEALDKAEQALTNSENAVDDAQTALNTANNAEGVAIQAQNDVSNLSGTVTNIGNRVTTAEGNITNLQGRMTTAEGNITNLQGRMTTAEGNIGNLQTAVSTAQAIANSAQQTATTARQQSFVFRYSSTALVASSTNSNTLLDNTDNLKVGDKVIDSSGVLFSVTAIDTQNSTFTIGTALIDLAQDSDVVHKSGDETVGGKKTFTDELTASQNTTNGALNLQNLSYDPKTNGQSAIGSTKSFAINALTSTSDLFSAVSFYGASDRTIIRFTARYYTDSQNFYNDSLEYTLYGDGTKSFRPRNNNNTTLGESSRKWKEVYATNYYYGSNNIEFSTKFVTTDTNQTISGQKVFTDINTISNSAEIGVSGGNNSFKVLDKNNKTILRLDGGTYSSGMAYSYWLINNGSDVFNGVTFYQQSANLAQLRPYSSTLSVQLGSSSRSFSDCYTSKINSLEPSSLGMPDLSNGIDISSYIDVSQVSTNYYTPPANGWISISVTTSARGSIQIECGSGFRSSVYSSTNPDNPSDFISSIIIPCVKNDTATIYFRATSGGTIKYAKFYPCQGNV